MPTNTKPPDPAGNDLASVRASFESADKRLRMCAGHIVRVSAAHDAGTLQLDTGEMVDFVIADATQCDAKDLHVGDHAWVTVNESDNEPRVLLCPTRAKMLRVRLAE